MRGRGKIQQFQPRFLAKTARKYYLCSMEISKTDILQYRIRRLELKTSFLSGIVAILIAVVTGIVVFAL